jgi:hypothetical protein
LLLDLEMRAFVMVMIVIAMASHAVAQPVDDTPWGRGVSAEARTRAQGLLEQGNAHILEGRPREALASYEAAIAVWDHPAIRFNIVRALIALDRTVEAADNLDRALRFGAAPLEEQVYAEAQSYKRLLAAQIGTLVVQCDQIGVTITVDGALFVQCPGRAEKRLVPGMHELVARGAGLLAVARSVLVLGAKTTTEDVRLQSLADATVRKRRWAAWKPWSVAAGGVALLGIGALLERQAAIDYDGYRGDLARQCAEVSCPPGTISSTIADRAATENRLAIGAFALGGAALLTGAVLVWLNQPRIVVEADPQGATVSIAGRF